MKGIERYIFMITLFLISTTLMAGTEDFLRSTGKIYAVVGVILIIFIGLMIYLIRLDRRITKIEEKTNQ